MPFTTEKHLDMENYLDQLYNVSSGTSQLKDVDGDASHSMDSTWISVGEGPHWEPGPDGKAVTVKYPGQVWLRSSLDWREEPRRVVIARNYTHDAEGTVTRKGDLDLSAFVPLDATRGRHLHWELDTRTYGQRYDNDIKEHRREKLTGHVTKESGLADHAKAKGLPRNHYYQYYRKVKK